MRFSSWYPANEIDARAPAGEGVFQVRAAELLSYPSGKSAMIHYARAEDMRAAMRAWAESHGREGDLYRHVGDLGSLSPDAALERVRSRFRSRFGSLPQRAESEPTDPAK